MKVNVNGVWRDSKPQAKVAGSWRECVEGFVKTGDVWQQFLESDSNLGPNEYVITVGTPLFFKRLPYVRRRCRSR